MKENKMGVMEVRRLLLTMSVPIMISMLIQALYNIVDSMFVARISQDALAAVSLCFPVQMLIIAVSCGLGVGLNALLSRRLGQKRREEAGQVALHGLAIALVCAVLTAALGVCLAPSFLSLFSDETAVIEMGVVYMRICTLFSFGVYVQIAYERIMQATGNPIYNMLIQGIGALTNIILDPIFIFGLCGVPAMGIAGAAIATVIGQTLAMGIGIIITNRKVHEIEMQLRRFRFQMAIVKEILRIGIPAVIMQSVMSFMTVFINMILASFSTLAISVFSIYYKLQQFAYMAVGGMNNALIPIISYNYGALKKERILQTIRFALLLCTGMMFVAALIFQLFPSALLYLFDADAAMLDIGIPLMRIISLSFLFGGLTMVLCSIFQAVNHGFSSMVITLFRQLVLLVPLTALLAFAFGLDACWWAFVITEALCFAAGVFMLLHVRRTTIAALPDEVLVDVECASVTKIKDDVQTAL